MSLVDKVADRVSRQHEDEVSASLGLLISLLHHFPIELQLHARLLWRFWMRLTCRFLKKSCGRRKGLSHRSIAFSDEAGATFLYYVLNFLSFFVLIHLLQR
jgi:U3 small nucleolar RNA-associated protein 10